MTREPKLARSTPEAPGETRKEKPMPNARVIGTGHYLPEKIVTNFDLEEMMDTTDEWIRQRTGIHERRIAADNQAASDLAINAAKRALEDAGIDPAEIDYIILATCSPDHFFPSTACVVQQAIGAVNAGALDINAACSGFVYGLELAHCLIRAEAHKTILLIGTENLTMHVDWSDRNTAVLFADGAGAALLRATEGDHCVLATHIGADGDSKDILTVPAGGSREPVTPENINIANRTIYMNGRELYKRAVVRFVETVEKVLQKADITGESVDLFIPHQANTRIIFSASKRIGIPDDKIFINLDKTGNTSAASIPIAIDQARRSGRLKPGDVVLFAAFGAGLTWASALMRW